MFFVTLISVHFFRDYKGGFYLQERLPCLSFSCSPSYATALHSCFIVSWERSKYFYLNCDKII